MPIPPPLDRKSAASGLIALPAPRRTGEKSVEAVISKRRSLRDFAGGSMALAELGQLLWAAQGVTDAEHGRTAPSAGATYPLELYAVAGSVDGLPAGIYHYEPHRHALRAIASGERRIALAAAALSQSWMEAAAVVLVIAAMFERTTGKYGGRGERFVHMEAGHAGQNVCLQAAALGLGTTVVGAFEDKAVKAIIGVDQLGEPLCLLPVGRRYRSLSEIAREITGARWSGPRFFGL